MSKSEAYSSLLDRLAGVIIERHSDRILRVGIDGVDGAGKTTFANDLAAEVFRKGRSTIRASVDDFHNPRIQRYARGRGSPDGFYLDSYNYDAFRVLLLNPLSPGGSGRFAPKSFNHGIDAPVPLDWKQAEPGAALILDGIFIHRPELRIYWDISIFLKVGFETSIPRGAQRGASFGSPDIHAESNRRYIGGQKRYFAECAPEESASIVIDYNDLLQPKILKQL